ncbi:MAG: NUDIX hydrolase [Bacteroidetes bacterium QH_6_63_17]|nr:MAG: NUDIX hydrolase [Bacteroidetes bacterium QH_6_63_17]
MADLTETQLSSEQLVDGVLLKAFRDEVRLPNDQTSVREWIDHPGASPEDVARRELEEETGVQAGRFEHAGMAYPCIGYSSERIHVFTAHDLERGSQSLAEGEFVEVVEMGFDEALRRARQGDLKDMKTVTALVYAAAHANETFGPA